VAFTVVHNINNGDNVSGYSAGEYLHYQS